MTKFSIFLTKIVQISLDGTVQKRYAYDALENVTAVEDALGNKASYRYSPEGKLTGVTDPDGNRAVYIYNGRDELTGILRLSAQEAESCTFLPPGENAEIPDKELYYANARKYHAGSGRFLTKDLISYMDLKKVIYGIF